MVEAIDSYPFLFLKTVIANGLYGAYLFVLQWYGYNLLHPCLIYLPYKYRVFLYHAPFFWIEYHMVFMLVVSELQLISLSEKKWWH